MTTPDSLVETRWIDDIAVVTMDDGKANALSFAMIDAIRESIAASEPSKAIVLAGRTGMFSAGLDLAVVNGGDDSALARLMANARDLYCDLLETQVPVVAACTGHAIAGGAMLLLCSDYRVGQSGHAKIGLSEVSTGIALPQFGCDLAARRLARGFHLRATALAEVFDPPTAREAGFLDQVIEVEVVSASIECAIGLVSRLDGGAFATTKARVLRSFLDSHATARQVQMTESLSR